MPALIRPWGAMHYRIDGAADGPTVVFANSLGTDLHLWDEVVRLMPQIRAVRFDKPGHGLSDIAAGVTVEGMAADAAALIQAVATGPVIFAGLSIGGMIAQALAAQRGDLVRGLVLSNTAARMGTAESWAARIDAVRAGGLEAIADAVMERWFATRFRAGPDLALWRNMMIRTPIPGYIAACEALAAADLSGSTAALRLPVMVIAGEEDQASPPELVAETAASIPAATFHTLPVAGHLPPVETPQEMARLIGQFVARVQAG